MSFAEIHSAIARKYREKEITFAALSRLRDQFEKDWTDFIEALELSPQTLVELPRLVQEFPLKAADAIQLSSALWLRDRLASAVGEDGRRLEFGASDRNLVEAARKCGLEVFNPEER